MLKQITFVSSLMAMSAVAALAADPNAPPAASNQPKPLGQHATVSTTATSGEVVTHQKQGELRANNLIGMRVQGGQDEKIGKINDLVIDESGQVSAAVISIGGFLGIGDKVVAVPWRKVRFDGAEKSALLDMTREELASAPEFRTKEQIESDRHSEATRQRLQQPQGESRPLPNRTPAQ